MPTLQVKLKKAHPDVKQYIAELKKENERLQAQIAKYQVKQFSLDNRMKALEKEIEENRPVVHFNLDSGHQPTLAELTELAGKFGYRLEKTVSS